MGSQRKSRRKKRRRMRRDEPFYDVRWRLTVSLAAAALAATACGGASSDPASKPSDAGSGPPSQGILLSDASAGLDAGAGFDAGSWADASPGMPTGDLYAVTATGPKDVWAAGGDMGDGFILHYDGTAWSFALKESSTGFSGVWANSPTDAWAVGTYPGESLYMGDIEHWNGSAWAPVTNIPSSTSYLWDVWGSGASDVWAVGNIDVATGDGIDAAVLHFDGSTWSVAFQNEEQSFTRVWGSGPSDVWVGGGGGIEHYDGTSWSAVGPSTATVGWASAANDVWAAGVDDDAGVLFHWNGQAWSSGTPVGPGSGVVSLWGSGPSGIWSVGNVQTSSGGYQGFALYWNGVAWSEVSAGVGTSELNAVGGSGPGNVWVVGDNGLILRLE
jgi:hypothetical protein